jgi:uncharacterized protein
MIKDYLPIQVNPMRLAENAANMHGHLLIKDMARLGASLHTQQGDADVDLQFGIDQQGIRFIKGSAVSTVVLQCQRCMEAFEHEISGEFAYGIVSSEEKAKQLPGRYDPIFVVEENLNIQDLVEEELILNLPIVPMHCSEDCKIQLPIVVAADPEAVVEKENPFKVIELLKAKNKEK